MQTSVDVVEGGDRVVAATSARNSGRYGFSERCDGPLASETPYAIEPETYSVHGEFGSGRNHLLGPICQGDDALTPGDSVSNGPGNGAEAANVLGLCKELFNLGYNPDQAWRIIGLLGLAVDDGSDFSYDSSTASTRSGIRKAEYIRKNDAMPEVPGCCYLWAVRRSKRTLAYQKLGAYPTFKQLFTLQDNWLARGEWRKVFVTSSTDATGKVMYHLSREPIGDTFESVLSSMTGTYGRLVPEQWGSHYHPASPMLPAIVAVVGGWFSASATARRDLVQLTKRVRAIEISAREGPVALAVGVCAPAAGDTVVFESTNLLAVESLGKVVKPTEIDTGGLFESPKTGVLWYIPDGGAECKHPDWLERAEASVVDKVYYVGRPVRDSDSDLRLRLEAPIKLLVSGKGYELGVWVLEETNKFMGEKYALKFGDLWNFMASGRPLLRTIRAKYKYDYGREEPAPSTSMF